MVYAIWRTASNNCHCTGVIGGPTSTISPMVILQPTIRLRRFVLIPRQTGFTWVSIEKIDLRMCIKTV